MTDETTCYGTVLCLTPWAALLLGVVFAWMVSGDVPLTLGKRVVCGAFIGFFTGVVGAAVPIDIFLMPRQVGWILPTVAGATAFPPIMVMVFKYGWEWVKE